MTFQSHLSQSPYVSGKFQQTRRLSTPSSQCVHRVWMPVTLVPSLDVLSLVDAEADFVATCGRAGKALPADGWKIGGKTGSGEGREFKGIDLLNRLLRMTGTCVIGEGI